MRKFREVYKGNLVALIEVLTDNGCRLEVHKTPERDGYYNNFYDVFILGSTKEKNDD